MEIKINIDKPDWSKKVWYIIAGSILALILLVSLLIHFNSETSEAKRQAEQYILSEVSRMVGGEVPPGTKFKIDSLEKRADEETADEVIYDITGTLIHPNVEEGTDELVTEYVYFYVIFNKIQETWHYGQVQPDRSRE